MVYSPKYTPTIHNLDELRVWVEEEFRNLAIESNEGLKREAAAEAEIADLVTDVAANVAAIAALDTRIDLLETPVAFHVVRSADDTGKTGGADNKINFSTETYDSHGFFDSATNFRFQPTVAGRYFIVVAMETAVTLGDGPQAAIYKSGSAAHYGTYTASPVTGVGYSTVAGFVQLNGSTDYVEGWAYVPTGQTVITGGADNTYMFGFRVSS